MRGRQVVAVAHAAAAVVVVEASLRVVPLPRLCRWLGVALDLESPVGGTRRSPLPSAVRSRWWAVDSVMKRWPGGDTCLRRSLVGAVLLRRLSPVLRLGWSTRAQPPTAHAWLEIGGESLDRDMAGVLPLRAGTR